MPIEISNVTELQAMENDLTGNYVLVNDIDASDTVNWNSGQGFAPLGPESNFPFTGYLNGAGYSITGLFVDRPDAPWDHHTGLFGRLDGEGIRVENLAILDADITGVRRVGILAGIVVNSGTEVRNVVTSGFSRSNTTEASRGTGGVVGYVAFGSIIRDCVNYAHVIARDIAGGVVGSGHSTGIFSTVYGCENHGNVSPTLAGQVFSGGVAGLPLNLDIFDCANYGIISASAGERIGGVTSQVNINRTVARCSNYGSVSAVTRAAGVVWFSNRGTIRDCYNAGSVHTTSGFSGGLMDALDASGGETTRCYSTGVVSAGSGDIGGLICRKTEPGPSPLNSFWDTESSATSVSDGGTGKTTAEMQDIDTFTDTATAGLDTAWDMVLKSAHDGEQATAVWFIDDGVDYPRLWSEYPQVVDVTAEAQDASVTPSVSSASAVDESSPIHSSQTGLVLVPDQDPAAPTLFRDYQGLLNPCEYGDEIGFWVDTRNGREIGGDVLVNGDFSGGLTGWLSGGSASANYLGDGVVEITGSGLTSSSVQNWAIYQDATGSDPSRWGVFRIEARHISGGRLFFGGNYDRNDVEAVDNGGEWTEYQAFVRRWPASDSTVNRSVNIGGDSGAVWQVRNLSLRMFPGNGAFQKVDTRKPILGRLPYLGRRNILRDSRKPHLWSRSAEFTYAPATDPFGGQEAGEFDLTIEQNTSRSFAASRELPIEDSRYCFSIWLKAGTLDAANLYIFDSTLSSGRASTMEVVSGPGQHVNSHPSLKVVTGLSTSQWTLLKVVSDSSLTPGNNVSFRVYPGETVGAGQPDGSLFAYGPQAERGTHVSAYQKTGNIHDVFDTSPGAKHYTFVFFDGIDDHLASAPVLMLPHSEAQYTLGADIRESSDSLALLLNQNSTGGDHWFLDARTTATRAGYNNGGQRTVGLISGASAPRVETISVQMEHAAPSIRGRIDGGDWAQTTAGDGTGGFTNDQLFIGSQTFGSMRFFHGLLYGLALSDGVDDDVIDANEWWVNQRTQTPPPSDFWYPEFWNPGFWSGGFWGEDFAIGPWYDGGVVLLEDLVVDAVASDASIAPSVDQISVSVEAIAAVASEVSITLSAEQISVSIDGIEAQAADASAAVQVEPAEADISFVASVSDVAIEPSVEPAEPVVADDFWYPGFWSPGFWSVGFWGVGDLAVDAVASDVSVTPSAEPVEATLDAIAAIASEVSIAPSAEPAEATLDAIAAVASEVSITPSAEPVEATLDAIAAVASEVSITPSAEQTSVSVGGTEAQAEDANLPISAEPAAVTLDPLVVEAIDVSVSVSIDSAEATVDTPIAAAADASAAVQVEPSSAEITYQADTDGVALAPRAEPAQADLVYVASAGDVTVAVSAESVVADSSTFAQTSDVSLATEVESTTVTLDPFEASSLDVAISAVLESAEAAIIFDAVCFEVSADFALFYSLPEQELIDFLAIQTFAGDHAYIFEV